MTQRIILKIEGFQDLAIGSGTFQLQASNLGLNITYTSALHKNNESESNEPVNFIERIGLGASTIYA